MAPDEYPRVIPSTWIGFAPDGTNGLACWRRRRASCALSFRQCADWVGGQAIFGNLGFTACAGGGFRSIAQAFRGGDADQNGLRFDQTVEQGLGLRLP